MLEGKWKKMYLNQFKWYHIIGVKQKKIIIYVFKKMKKKTLFWVQFIISNRMEYLGYCIINPTSVHKMDLNTSIL